MSLSRLVITFLPRSKHLLISWLQSPSAVILEPQKIKSDTVSTVSPSISHEVIGPDAMILVFWMLSFKPTFSLSSFTFIKRLFSSSSLSAIRVVSSAYLVSLEVPIQTGPPKSVSSLQPCFRFLELAPCDSQKMKFVKIRSYISLTLCGWSFAILGDLIGEMWKSPGTRMDRSNCVILLYMWQVSNSSQRSGLRKTDPSLDVSDDKARTWVSSSSFMAVETTRNFT